MDNREKNTEGYKINMAWLRFIPIIILIGIVPLIVRLVLVDIVDSEAIAIWNTTNTTDMFSQFKASFISFLAVAMLVVSFLIFNKKELKIDQNLKIIYGALGIYGIFTVLSTVLSQYKHTALWGAVDRAEGGIMLIAYMIIMLYTLYVWRNTIDYKYITLTLVALTGILVILGFFQYIGEDLLVKTIWGQKLIIPEKYAAYRSGLESLYEERRAYGTLFHYNYVGSFTAMVIPLFATLCLFGKGWTKKIIYGIGLISGVFLLFFSTSRAGIVAVGACVVVWAIFCFKIIIKKWKLTIPLLLVAVIGVVGLNAGTHGQLFERIPSLVRDAFGLFLPAEETLDYKESLPIQDVTHEDKRAVLWMDGHQLKMEATEEGLGFKDENEVAVQANFVNNTYTFQDERFKGIQIEKIDNSDAFGNYWRVQTRFGHLIFQGNTFSNVHLVDIVNLTPIELERPETIGFKGKERIGSARGYIWSRSLPILKDNILIGDGPDSFVFSFPQHDYLGKMYAYGKTNMIVDKPHNLYLQIGINQGMIALLAFLILVGVYLVQSIRMYALKGYYQERQVVGMAFMLAIVGYLVAGIFNDSVVSVAPIFWVLLGGGMALNYLNMKQNKREESTELHATIDMKKRKHIHPGE